MVPLRTAPASLASRVEQAPHRGDVAVPAAELLAIARPAFTWNALCATSGELNGLRDHIAFFQAARVWMAKFDVADRRARGLPVPAEVARDLRQLTAGLVEAVPPPTSTLPPGSNRRICPTWTRRSRSGCARPATRTWRSRRAAVDRADHAPGHARLQAALHDRVAARRPRLPAPCGVGGDHPGATPARSWTRYSCGGPCWSSATT